MYTYKIYNEEFAQPMKEEWFLPQDVEGFYDETAEEAEFFRTEDEYIEAASEFMKETGALEFVCCENEIYREYYGMEMLRKKYPGRYDDEISEIYENTAEGDTVSAEKAKNILRLVFRGHMWCILKSGEDVEIYFEKPGILTVLSAKECTFAVKNIKNLQIIAKDFQ